MFFIAALLVIGSSAASATGRKDEHSKRTVPGIEVLLKEEKALLKGKRVGLITNPTGTDSKLNSSVDLLNNDPDINLTALYGPEHGVRGDADAGANVESYIDEETGLPVYSLYGKTNKPTPEMLKDVDVLVFDIQDIGTRFYTYISTLSYCLEAAKENNKQIIVLDRPNSIGGEKVEGPVLDPAYSSFVGRYPIPLRHGMTMGELALLFNKEFNIHADLKVVKMKGWKRSQYFNETGLPFIMPSPNMPTLETAIVYPGAGLIEGINVSEGRGTTKPFQLFGAPYINSTKLAAELNKKHLKGVQFRAASFIPSTSKYAGELCHGAEIYVTDPKAYNSVETGLEIISEIHRLYPDKFEFLARDNFSLLIGNGWVKQMILDNVPVKQIMKKYEAETQKFKQIRKQYLLYK
nr:DUF1343 domain-containing protein [Metabacillus kandeliae]